MKDKEKLLDIRFMFSHYVLREGWDKNMHAQRIRGPK
jgi:restriction endonuclease